MGTDPILSLAQPLSPSEPAACVVPNGFVRPWAAIIVALVAKRALITGITGQDGSYLAELLLAKNYEVHGIVRRVALEDPSHQLNRLSGVLDRVSLHAASLESFPSLCRVFQKTEPHECYHLAAQSFVGYSVDDEFSTFNANINGTHHVLAALKDIAPKCRFYFAGSSEMFGDVVETPQV